MTQYELILPYNKIILISEAEKEEIEKRLEEGGLIKVQSEWVDTKSIRGIFAVQDSGRIEHDRTHVEEINREFETKLAMYQKQSPEEKARREVRSRVWMVLSLTKPKKTDPIIGKVYDSVLGFFQNYPDYPWCPLRHWWGLVENMVKTRTRKGWATNKAVEIILRHDYAYEDWMRSQSHSLIE